MSSQAQFRVRSFLPLASLIWLMPLLTQSGCANVAGSASAQHATNSAPAIVTQPVSQAVSSGQTANFSVTVLGTAPLSYQWERNGAAISGATSASYTTRPETTSAQFAVVVSNSVGSVTSNTAALTIATAPVTVTVNPGNLTLAVGGTQSFSGNISGTSNGAITWTVSGSGCTGGACGTISASGLYVAPMSVPSPPSVTVRATSVADPSKSASASVTIVAAVAVLLSLSPTNASVVTASTQTFNASVTGTSNTAVTWNVNGAGCSGAACGSLSTSGLRAVYSAPSIAPSPATVIVTAVSAADSTKSASATMTIVPVVAVTVSPGGLSIATGTTQQFNATVTGNSNIAVTWSVSGAGCSGVACGTISGAGLYTAPAAIPSPATITVTATSSADPSKSGVAYLTIVAPGKTGPTLPTLPQATVDLTMPIQGTSVCPTLTTGSNCIRNVPAGDAVNFQKAINAATCGDTIVLVAGSTYSGNFTIPATTCTNNSGWMVIKSSATASLPATNNRVGPSNVSNMAKVSTPNTSPAFEFAQGSNHWRIIGLEITQSYISTSNTVYNLVLSDGSSSTSTSTLPAFVIFDRIYLHGLSNANTTRGINADFQTNALVDSYCSDIHSNGQDSQCINSTNGIGPFLIQNNFLQAAGENIMFGGQDPLITNLISSDITIVGNLMTKPLSWRNQAAPLNWVVKNIFELKNAQRLLFDGNVLQYTWAAGQAEAVLIRGIQGGNANWTAVQDITFTNNLIQHAPAGVQISGENGGAWPASTARILVQNNLILDISSATWSGPGEGFLVESGQLAPYLHDVVIDHNTVLSDNKVMDVTDGGSGGGSLTSNFQFTNNITDLGQYGIFGDGVGSGTIALSTYAPGYIYSDIVITNSTGTSSGTYPTGTLWSTQANIAYTSVSGSDPSLTGNFQLLNSSPYYHAGTDGEDVGVWNWTVFNAKTTNAIGGTYQ